MSKNNFKVLKGGLLDSAVSSRKLFVSAYVTNTRLMGVLGMYIHFKLPDNQTLEDLHQFFYFDAEDYGFESYHSVLGSDSEKVLELENMVTGGLGGEKIPLTLREAQYLLQEYVRFNKKAHLPLPEGKKEYGFLLEQDILLSEPDLYILMCKQCISIESPFALINYFLMRIIGRDFGAASFLTTQNFPLDLFPEFKTGTFCKNIIDEGNLPDTYICESLLQFSDSYYLAVTHISLTGMSVSGFQRVSLFRISPAEAAMMLSRSEFITVYEMLQPPEIFSKASTRLVQKAMITPHENGTLYMMFHSNNNHVAKRVYRLNEDVLGMYYVTSGGQLLSAAYSLEEIRLLEKDLGTALIGTSLLTRSKYEFQEPVLYEFIQSGFEDFEDFVDAIKTGEN